MFWNRRYALISYVRSSLWSAPLVAVVVAQLIFRVFNEFDVELGWIPGFTYTPAGRLMALDTAITLNLSFMVFAFGSLLVAIQVASGQLTPRIIATMLLRDNGIRWSVGLFSFGLLLAIGARNRLDSIPDFVVSLAGLLAFVAAVTFLFLIDYAARMLRPVSIMWRVGEQGLKVIDEVYPGLSRDAPAAVLARPKPAMPGRQILQAGTSAIVLAVNIDTLVAAARKSGGIIEFVPQIGDFVAVGEPLFLLHGGAAVLDDRVLRAQVAFGRERTMEHDVTFAFRVIVDIAVKALSKAINDPTTAVLAIDQLHRLLRTVGKRHLHDDIVCDKSGEPRLVFRTPNWEAFVQLSCSEIRHYGVESIQVARRLRAMIDNLIPALPEYRRPELRRELDLLDRTLERVHLLPEDLALARTADTQGVGGTVAR